MLKVNEDGLSANWRPVALRISAKAVHEAAVGTLPLEVLCGTLALLLATAVSKATLVRGQWHNYKTLI